MNNFAAIDTDTGELLHEGSAEQSRRAAISRSIPHRSVAVCELVNEQNVTMWLKGATYYNGELVQRKLRSKAAGT